MNENTLVGSGALGATRTTKLLDGPAAGTGIVSAVSWGAIFAGAAGAAALSLILLVLGTGLGLSSVSPWSSKGVSAETFGISTVIWITLTSLAASGMGGYLAGRLRTRWIGTHGDEVYFRDTAHGFLAWAVATLVTAAMLTSTIGAIVSGGAQAGATVAGGAAGAITAVAPAAAAASPMGPGYYVDMLFRKDATSTAPATTDDTGRTSAEVARIVARSVQSGTMTPDDKTYVGQLVAQRTGLAQADAEKRVTDTFTRLQAAANEADTKAREAADAAKKATAYAALWLFVSLLAGAFVASLMATYGGRRRDLF
ncbi:hypothetical protein BH10PSE17_BH10PSE17_10010 [soil metagenome]